MTLERDREIAGWSNAAHMEQVQQTLGEAPPGMPEEPEIPVEGAYVWQSFWQLKRSGSITYREIEAYQAVTHTPLEPWETDALIEMDITLERWRHRAGNQ